MNHNYRMEHGNLAIVPMSEEYSEEYRCLRNLPQNMQFFFCGSIISKVEQKKWYKEYLNDDSQIMFAVLENGSFIGGCGLYNIDLEQRIAEFGRIVISSEKRKKGFGVLSTKMVLQIAKIELNLSIVYLEVKDDNMDAIKAYVKAGFSFDKENSKNGKKQMYKRLQDKA